jgi:predicted RecB family nuclease
MAHIITNEIVVAYSQCPWKAFLLLRSENRGAPHEYVRFLAQEALCNKIKYLNNINKEHLGMRPKTAADLTLGVDVLIDAPLKFRDLVTDSCILHKSILSSSLGNFSYTPAIIVGTHKITKEQKLSLSFDGYLLGKIQNLLPISGIIVGGDGQTHKVNLESSARTIKLVVDTLRGWTGEPPSKPPQLILNKHCSLCQFQTDCLDQAEKDDNLSLLDRITAKKIRDYQKKGIFSVTQLSYLFKPRRHRKRNSKSPVSFNVELQALALRMEKIYIQEIPVLPRQDVEIFLDIEGIPDQNFHYLIGLLISEHGKRTYHSFWANTPEDERQIWVNALEKINDYPDAPIYHYGSYEPHAITGLTQKYLTNNGETLENRLRNLNTGFFGKVYFPSKSNSLKALGKLIGASWTAPDASGLQSLVWRHHWEESGENHVQEKLITYNHEDCEALWLLAEELSKIVTSADEHMHIDYVDKPKQQATKLGKEIHDEFTEILRYAHSDYDKKRVNIRSQQSTSTAETVIKKRGATVGHQGFARAKPLKANVIRVMPKRTCPKHNGERLLYKGALVEKYFINLRFTKTGCKKVVTKYVGSKGYCQKCHRDYSPPKITELGSQQFGHAFQSWVIYQRIVLRLPYRVILQELEDFFNETMSESTLISFMRYFAKYYSVTEKLSMQRILESPFVHADETPINIQGTVQYVWVFTNGTHVVFKITETRESTIVHELFSDYKGVLISDFWGGYDSVTCRQQKCLVHLIRDLNNDLWDNPYNREYEAFVSEVKHLLVPIFEAEKKYGLKSRHFRKFRKSIDQFYCKNIDKPLSSCELIATYQKRFQRFKDSLFTFLELDGIPWHNNTAENAIRHLAVQRKISGTFFKKVVNDYLLLLGIAQTCRFQGKSLLKFFLSEVVDLDKFKGAKRIKKSYKVGSQINKEGLEIQTL